MSNAIVVLEILDLILKRDPQFSYESKFLAIKLDMMKAYDRVSWEFLKFMLQKFQFTEQFIRLIMRCVTSLSILILINGESSQFFCPSRGLRQGDPISPLLFNICMTGMSGLIKKFNQHRVWKKKIC